MADIINIKTRRKTSTKKPSRKHVRERTFERFTLRERRRGAMLEIARLCVKLEKYPDVGLIDKIIRDMYADRLTQVDVLAVYLYRKRYNLNIR